MMRIPTYLLLSVLCLSIFAAPAALLVHAQEDPQVNITSDKFKLSICDGPNLPGGNPSGYVACDFRGAMLQTRYLINVMIILGVVFAVFGFAFAGYLYVTGTPGNISRAHIIFRKTGVGFIIMISAWFIVYQILTWLVANPGVKTLLGNPN